MREIRGHVREEDPESEETDDKWTIKSSWKSDKKMMEPTRYPKVTSSREKLQMKVKNWEKIDKSEFNEAIEGLKQTIGFMEDKISRMAREAILENQMKLEQESLRKIEIQNS